MIVALVYRICSRPSRLALAACASAPVALVALPPAPACARAHRGPGPERPAARVERSGLSRRLSRSGRPRRKRARRVEEHRMGGAPVGGRRAGAARCALAAARRFARPDQGSGAFPMSISRSSSLRLIRKERPCVWTRDGFSPAPPRSAPAQAAPRSTCLWRPDATAVAAATTETLARLAMCLPTKFPPNADLSKARNSF